MIIPGLGIEDIETLRILLSRKKRVTTLANEFSLLKQKSDELERRRGELADEKESLLHQQKDTHVPEERLAELKRAVACAKQEGAIEQQLATAKSKAEASLKVCREGLSQLGRFTGSLETLRSTQMVLPATLDAYEKKIDEYSERLATGNHQLLAKQDEEQEVRYQLLLLENKDELPTLAELHRLRKSRDDRWLHIKRSYTKVLSGDHEGKNIDEAASFLETFEKKLAKTDSYSDRLRLAADSIVKKMDLEARARSISEQQLNLKSTIKNLTRDLDDCLTSWQRIWEPLRIEAGTPREMKQWILQVDNLLKLSRTADELVTQQQQLQSKVDELQEMIRHSLTNYDEMSGSDYKGVQDQIALAEQYIKKDEAMLERKEQVVHSLQGVDLRLQRITEELKGVKQELRRWSKQWEEAISGLHVTTDGHPSLAIEAMERLEQCFDRWDKSEDLRRRIYGMDQVLDSFAQDVARFAGEIEYEYDGVNPAAVVVHLYQELNDAKERRARFEKSKALVKEKELEIEEANISLASAQEQLALMKGEAAVETEEELSPISEKSSQKRHLIKNLEMVEHELLRSGDGLSLVELEHESQELSYDSLESHMEQLAHELDNLHEKRDLLRDQRQRVQSDIDSNDGSQNAARAREEQELLRTRIISASENYLRNKIGALILEQHIEAYRKRNQAPLLKRAGLLFSKLTLGTYSHLRDDVDKNGTPYLLGVKRNEREVPIHGMSDGTRDQLYLALRLATLERHLENNEPMPFIVDDILIGFDDDRSAACLEVLLELSDCTQVLLFTHHRRLLELSGSLSTDQGVFHCEL